MWTIGKQRTVDIRETWISWPDWIWRDERGPFTASSGEVQNEEADSNPPVQRYIGWLLKRVNEMSEA
jgi:hypothetical protein